MAYFKAEEGGLRAKGRGNKWKVEERGRAGAKKTVKPRAGKVASPPCNQCQCNAYLCSSVRDRQEKDIRAVLSWP